MTTATLTSKGQITIPSDVRRRLGLESGDRSRGCGLSERAGKRMAPRE